MVAGARWISRAWSCGAILWASQAVLAVDAASTEAQPAAQAVPAKQTVLLSYKFQPGQFVYYEVSDRVRYVMQQSGSTAETYQRNDSAKHFRVVSIDEDGSMLLEPIIDRIKMSAGSQDSTSDNPEARNHKPPIEFDSEKDKVAPAEFQRHKETVGKPMARFKYAPNGELLAVRIIDADLAKANAAANAQSKDPDPPQSKAAGTPKSNATEVPESIVSATSKPNEAAAAKPDQKLSFLIPLPKEPITVGHRWKQKYDEPVNVGQGLRQQIPMLRQFELTSISDGIATIKFRTSILALLNDPKIQGQLAQQTPSGTIEFDIERGLIRSRKSVTNEAVVNAFGPQSLLQVVGESAEKMIAGEAAIQQVGFTKESDSSGK